MDAEIAALEARREKTCALKQGMMQELLTGRIRLVEPKAEGADSKSSEKVRAPKTVSVSAGKLDSGSRRSTARPE